MAGRLHELIDGPGIRYAHFSMSYYLLTILPQFSVGLKLLFPSPQAFKETEISPLSLYIPLFRLADPL